LDQNKSPQGVMNQSELADKNLKKKLRHASFCYI